MGEETLRHEIDDLRRQLVDAARVVDALVGGRVDPVASAAAASPVMLTAAKEQLRRSETLLHAVFEEALDATLLLDDEGRYVDANAAACELFGVPKQKLVGLRLADFAAPGYDLPSMRRALQERGRIRGEFPLQRPDGSHRDLEYAAVANIAPGLHLSVLRDVTQRKEFERALKEGEQALSRRERHFRALIEKSADVIAAAAPDGSILYVSPSITRVFGYAPAERAGNSVQEHVHPDDLERARAAFAQVIAVPTQNVTYECRVRHRDGSWRWVEATLTNMIDDAAVRAIVGNVRDITDRKLTEETLRTTEEQLRQAQKMEAIGSLAGGIAHDFNNLLSVIISYASIVLDDLPQTDHRRADIEEVRKAGERAVDLTRQLLAFSRKQVLEPRVLDLNMTLAGMEKMLRRVLGEDVELSLRPSGTIGRVFGDPGQIEQVIMNLVVNARDAMPRGGCLTIETASFDADEAYATEHAAAGAAPGNHVMLSVRDSGTGMDAATRARIFEPFFTTKDTGTGLGLSTVLGIVRQSGGHVTVESEVGKGTTFRVHLPHHEESPATIAPPPSSSTTAHGNETVLLVEDEDQVRALIRTVLQRQGYVVLEAQNGGEAMLVCERYAGDVHLLLTDVVMPRMSGPQLAERLTVARPKMRVLYMSGYTDDAAARHGALDAGVPFLRKPLTPHALARKVREVLDG